MTKNCLSITPFIWSYAYVVVDADDDGWLIDWLIDWGLTTHQPLSVILWKEIEEIVEEIKERDREERGTGMKVKKQKK